MNCKKCGNIINKDALFCPICGEKNTVVEFSNTINETSQLNNNIDKKKNKKKIFIPIIIIIGVALMFFAGLFIGKKVYSKNTSNQQDNNTINDYNDNNDETDELDSYTHNLFVPSKVEKVINNTELGKNVTIDEIFFNPKYNSYSKYKEAYFYGKNNNSIPISLKLILEYYDSEGYRIEKRSSWATIIQPGKEFVFEMTIEDDSLNYTKVKLSYEVNNIKSYEKSISDTEVEVTSNLLADGNISIFVKNNSAQKMNGAYLACLYYKDDKLVFVQDAYVSTLEPNQSNESKCYIYKLNLNEDYSNLKRIEYDDYKVILYSAYSSDSTNY